MKWFIELVSPQGNVIDKIEVEGCALAGSHMQMVQAVNSLTFRHHFDICVDGCTVRIRFGSDSPVADAMRQAAEKYGHDLDKLQPCPKCGKRLKDCVCGEKEEE